MVAVKVYDLRTATVQTVGTFENADPKVEAAKAQECCDNLCKGDCSTDTVYYISQEG